MLKPRFWCNVAIFRKFIHFIKTANGRAQGNINHKQVIDSYLLLWEQHSKYNPNIPVLGFIYNVKTYDKYIKSRAGNIYGSKLMKIPIPRYIDFTMSKRISK